MKEPLSTGQSNGVTLQRSAPGFVTSTCSVTPWNHSRPTFSELKYTDRKAIQRQQIKRYTCLDAG